MRQIAIVSILLCIVGVASFAAGSTAPACCACLEGEKAETQGGRNGTSAGAFFCAAALGGDTGPLEDRCLAITNSTGMGGTLFCTNSSSNASCADVLTQAGIICPAAGVPAAAPLNLVALAVILGAVGTALMRRSRAAR